MKPLTVRHRQARAPGGPGEKRRGLFRPEKTRFRQFAVGDPHPRHRRPLFRPAGGDGIRVTRQPVLGVTSTCQLRIADCMARGRSRPKRILKVESFLTWGLGLFLTLDFGPWTLDLGLLLTSDLRPRTSDSFLLLHQLPLPGAPGRVLR